MNYTLENLKNTILESDLVLIGIGDEMQVKMADLKAIPGFTEKLQLLESKEEYEWIIPFLIKAYLKPEFHPEIVKAYKNLAELIQEKNYFVLSLSTDDLLKKADVRSDRTVYPLGTYELLQCSNPECKHIQDTDEKLIAEIQDWIDGKADVDSLKKPVCPECGNELVMNQYGQQKYNEAGYLDSWTVYTKWLQGTVNKKLCILELGVGMEFPSIVRWPFEKICFYNQKSTFIRVHSMLYQVAGDIEDRGVQIAMNPVDYLTQ